MLTGNQKLDERLPARYPGAREGVVEQRLMEERHTTICPYEKILRGEDVDIVVQVFGVEHFLRECESLASRHLVDEHLDEPVEADRSRRSRAARRFSFQ